MKRMTREVFPTEPSPMIITCSKVHGGMPFRGRAASPIRYPVVRLPLAVIGVTAATIQLSDTGTHCQRNVGTAAPGAVMKM